MVHSAADRSADGIPDDNEEQPEPNASEEDDVSWTDDVAPVRYPDNPVPPVRTDRP